MTDSTGPVEPLLAELAARGAQATAARGVAPVDRDAVARAVATALGGDGPLRGVIALWAAGDDAMTDLADDALLGAGQAGWAGTLHLAQALLARPLRDPPRLVMVTVRSQAPRGDEAIRPEQGVLWGLGGVIRSENGELRPLRVDLGDPDDADEIRALVAQALSPDDDDQVALRGTERHLARVARQPMPEPARYRMQPAGDTPYHSEVTRVGALDSIELHARERTAPGPGQIEIAVEAAGINFHDLLSALGEIPAEAGGGGILGRECTGRITRVGPGVDDLREGQRVLAIGKGLFGTHALTAAELAVPVPDALDRMSAEELTTLPIVQLTAYYGLHHVARLRRGERVLIHSAAGGVGLSAMQWARHVGATIYATAGTEEKRAWLREQGVDYVSDSRSDQFVADVLDWTDGEGVDVVLNSLAGSLLDKSFGLLRKDGRFVEIGKRDYLANSRLGLQPFLKGLSLTLVDLDGLMFRRSAEMRGVLREILDHVAAGVLAPLPHRAFPLSRISDALWTMGRGTHIGKFVVQVAEPEPRIAVPVAPDADLVRAAASYLITGGLGGLGLSLARSLADAGAG
ncbi:MAG: zinc-binding dehydrogenase, partial [Myxococcota bacterium]